MLVLAWRNIWRHTRRSLITVAAMSLGCAVCMSMMAFSDGMFATMFDVIVTQSLGHVRVENPAFPETRSLYDSVPDAQAKLDAIQELPGVSGVAWRAYGGALVGDTKSQGAELIGVDPELEASVGHPDRLVVEGRYLQGPGEILLGETLAEELEVGLGDSLVAMTQASDGSIGAGAYELVGTVRTGNVARDKGGAWLVLGDFQELMMLDDQVHELVILAEDGDDGVDALRDSVEAIVGGDKVLVRSWDQADPQLASMLKMGDQQTWAMLGIIFMLAGFGVLNTMLMSVFERTRELGVMRALGMSRGKLVQLVVTEAVILAAVGAVVGGLFGGALDYWICVIGVDLGYGDLEFGGIVFPDTMKGLFRLDRVVATLISMGFVAVLASVWPAVRAALLKPVEAMKKD